MKRAYIIFFALMLCVIIGLLVMTGRYELLHLRQEARQESGGLRTAILLLLGLIFILLCVCAILIFYQFNRRKQAERDLRQTESHFEWLVRHVKEYAIFQLDAEGRVLSWNEGAAQIKGYGESEILGKSISVFYPDEEVERREPVTNLEKAAAEGRFESIGRRKRKDGTLFWADVVFTAMYDEKGELTGFIKITRDITEQRRAQEEMEESLQKERSLNEMKSRFVTLASHEFKTPLSVILSSVSLIEKYHDPENADKRMRHIHRIKSNVNNLKQLLNDFLSLEKLEEGVIKNNPQPVDLRQLAAEGILDMEDACHDPERILLETTGDPREIAVDAHLLRNILNNLLSNAIKYSSTDSSIRVLLDFRDKDVLLSVTDEGIGIPMEEQEHLFERFFRASNTTGISGTGLGLSIVKRYLDLMGGVIEFDSQPGRGTTISVILPGLSVDRRPAELGARTSHP